MTKYIESGKMLKEGKILQECKMVKVWLATKDSKLPVAIAITTAPSEKEAEEHARQVLKPYIKPDLIFHTQDLGPIFYPPFPTTIFLYVQGAGRIK